MIDHHLLGVLIFIFGTLSNTEKDGFCLKVRDCCETMELGNWDFEVFVL